MATKQSLDIASVAGIGLGFGSLITSMVLEFGELNPDLGSPFLKISALAIIFGGTIGCTMLSFSMEEFVKIPTLFKIALFGTPVHPKVLIQTITGLAELARRDGILALEPKREELREEYPFLASGIDLIIDAQPCETVKELLTNRIYSMEERHKVGAEIFTTLGGFAPTMGIIGTVVGLIGALAKAGEGGEDPSAVVEAIATAFIATFYGIASANLLFLPLATKLQRRTHEELFIMQVQTEAVLAIENGNNPRLIEESLKTFFQKDQVE